MSDEHSRSRDIGESAIGIEIQDVAERLPLLRYVRETNRCRELLPVAH
jgi:hypothetical protein